MKRNLFLIVTFVLLAAGGLAQWTPPAPEVTVATLPAEPSAGDTVWVTDATGPSTDPEGWSCTDVGDPPVKLLCSWSGSAWVATQRQVGGSSTALPKQMIGSADRVTYSGDAGDWPEGLPSEVDAALDSLAARSGNLPAGGDPGDVIENTGPGAGAWVDPATVTVGAADALSTNPIDCTYPDYVNAMDADGTLNCDDPLSGRDLEDILGGGSAIGAAGNVRFSEAVIVEGNAVTVDAQGDLSDSGQPPGGAANTEDHDTTCTDGQGYLAASGETECGDVATDAELAAATLISEVLTGSVAEFVGAGVGIDLDVSAYAATYIENYENLAAWYDPPQGDWRVRSQGGVGSYDWRYEQFICYEPDHVFRIWINGHCGTVATQTNRNGGWCNNDDAQCPGASSKCIHGGAACPNKMWNTTPSPDEISFAACGTYWPDPRDPPTHDFGPAGSTFPLPMAIQRGGTSPPVHKTGGSAAYPSCNVTMTDAANYWVYVVDAYTLRFYLDDGDLVPELGAGDTGLDCTTMGDWQSLVLRPRTPAGADPSKLFAVALQERYVVSDSALAATGVCVGGSVSGSGCDDAAFTYNVDCTGGGFCSPNLYPFKAKTGLAKGNLEGITSAGLFGGATSGVYRVLEHLGFGSANDMAFFHVVPGECIGGLLYLQQAVDNELDAIRGDGGRMLVWEPQRSAPQRAACDYLADSSVSQACQWYGRLSNLGSTGSVELELDPLLEGMDFLAVNETGETFCIDPNGSERFPLPATDQDGDKLCSTDAGDAVRVFVPQDGVGRVIMTSPAAGFEDGGA